MVVEDHILLADGAAVVHHLDHLLLGVAISLPVLHDGLLVDALQVLLHAGEVDGLVALAAEGLDAVGEGVAVGPGPRHLGLLEDGGGGGLAGLPLPADGHLVGELLYSGALWDRFQKKKLDFRKKFRKILF